MFVVIVKTIFRNSLRNFRINVFIVPYYSLFAFLVLLSKMAPRLRRVHNLTTQPSSYRSYRETGTYKTTVGVRPLDIHSAVLIGFQFNDEQKMALKEADVALLSPETISSRADIDQVQLIAISLNLPQEEIFRIESLITYKGTVLRALNAERLVQLLVARFPQKRRRESH